MFQCQECKKKFSCNATLQEHKSRHTGEKPLKCSLCGRNFRQIAVLKRHMATHSSEKPFACPICDKRFSMKIYVQSHMKTHTGEFDNKFIYFFYFMNLLMSLIASFMSIVLPFHFYY